MSEPQQLRLLANHKGMQTVDHVKTLDGLCHAMSFLNDLDGSNMNKRTGTLFEWTIPIKNNYNGLNSDQLTMYQESNLRKYFHSKGYNILALHLEPI